MHYQNLSHLPRQQENSQLRSQLSSDFP